jgi:hypothetical protein
VPKGYPSAEPIKAYLCTLPCDMRPLFDGLSMTAECLFLWR